MKRSFCFVGLVGGLIAGAGICAGQSSAQVVLDRKGETIVLEPYAPNIVRVTLSLQRENALAKPGYGFVGNPDQKEWTRSQTDMDDVYRCSRMIVTVERPHPPAQPALSTQIDISKYFGGSGNFSVLSSRASVGPASIAHATSATMCLLMVCPFESERKSLSGSAYYAA